MRQVWDPLDAFRLVERNLCSDYGNLAVGFSEERRISELTRRSRCWENNQEDITLDEVYEELGQRNKHWKPHLNEFRQAELAQEDALLVTRPSVHQLACQAHQEGKEVWYLSDMYLPADFLSSLLRQRDFPTPENLRVSGEMRQGKHTGNLYKTILAERNAKPDEWLHLGDNKHADYKQARAQGIHAVLLPQARMELLQHRHFKKILPTQPPGTEPSRAVFYGLMAAHADKRRQDTVSDSSFWHELGYLYAGPLFLGYTAWVAQRAREMGLDRLFFLSRDGRFPKAVYEHITQGRQDYPPSTYLYASRRAVALPALTSVDDKALYLLAASQAPMTAQDYLARLGLDPALYSEQIRDAGLADVPPQVPDDAIRQKLAVLFRSLEQPILDLAARERKAYLRYLHEQGLTPEARVGLIDIGWHGSIQRSLEALLPQNPALCRGFYLATHPHAWPDVAFDSFLYHRGHPANRSRMVNYGIELLEFLFLADEASFLGMEENPDGSLRYKYDPQSGPEESYPLTREIHAGAMAFVQDYSRHADPLGEAPDAELVYELLHRLIEKPTTELVEHLGKVHFWEGFGTRTFPIRLATHPSAMQTWLCPWRAARSVKRSLWPPATLASMHPIPRLWLTPWLKVKKY